MPKLFGFCGRKRSGKTTLSKIVAEKYNGVILTVANYLKYMCCDILECSIDELNTKKDDGTTFSIYADERWLDIISNQTGIQREVIKNDLYGIEFKNIRQVLQIIGTDCIRKHQPDWHVNCLKKDIVVNLSKGKTVAVDDVRFPNEREAIEGFNGECYFIVRPITSCISNHISETALMWNMFDEKHVIINDSDIDTLSTNFKKHLDYDFTANFKYPILQYEKLGQYMFGHNKYFGLEKTPIIDKIIEQNKNTDLFNESGAFRFKPSSIEEYNTFLNELYIDHYPYHNIEYGNIYYLVYNPLIIENLKKWI